MTDLAHIGAELEAIAASSERQDNSKLIKLLRSNIPLTDSSREYLALYLEGKRKRGIKPNSNAKVKRQIELVKAYLWLLYVDGWKKKSSIYAELQALTGADSAASIKTQIMDAKKRKQMPIVDRLLFTEFNKLMLLYRKGYIDLEEFSDFKPAMLHKKKKGN